MLIEIYADFNIIITCNPGVLYFLFQEHLKRGIPY